MPMRVITLALLCSVLAPRVALAQSGEWADTTRAAAMQAALIHLLEHDISHAADAPAQRPWAVSAVGQDSLEWKNFLPRIRTFLNGRLPRDDDDFVSFIEISAHALTETSSRYFIVIGGRTRVTCAKKPAWMDGSITYTFEVVKQSSTWTARPVGLPMDQIPGECEPI